MTASTSTSTKRTGYRLTGWILIALAAMWAWAVLGCSTTPEKKPDDGGEVDHGGELWTNGPAGAQMGGSGVPTLRAKAPPPKGKPVIVTDGPVSVLMAAPPAVNTQVPLHTNVLILLHKTTPQEETTLNRLFPPSRGAE